MTTKSTVIPADPDDVFCQDCPSRYAYRGSVRATRDGARAAGWHILEGDLRLSVRALCPDCIGTPRTRIPAPPILEGQTDILDTLGVTPQPVEPESKRKPRRAIN